MPKDAPKPSVPSNRTEPSTLTALQEAHTSVKRRIADRANNIIDFVNIRIEQPQNLALHTRESRHRLTALIKELIYQHQLLYNALMNLADHTSLADHCTVTSRREEALERWTEEGERLGVLCYQARKYLGRELAHEMHDQSSFSWRKPQNPVAPGVLLEKLPSP